MFALHLVTRAIIGRAKYALSGVILAVLFVPGFVALTVLFLALGLTVTVGPFFIPLSFFLSLDHATILSGVILASILMFFFSLGVIDGERSRKWSRVFYNFFSSDKEKEKRLSKPLPERRPFLQVASRVAVVNLATMLGVSLWLGLFRLIFSLN